MCIEFQFCSSSNFRAIRGPTFTLRGAAPPARSLVEIFSYLEKSTWPCVNVCRISTFYLQQFPRYEGIPNLHQWVLRPRMPPSGTIFIPEKTTWHCVNVCRISTFQLQYFPRYEAVPNLDQGALRPRTLLSGQIFMLQKSTWPYLDVCEISTFCLSQFQRY